MNNQDEILQVSETPGWGLSHLIFKPLTRRGMVAQPRLNEFWLQLNHRRRLRKTVCELRNICELRKESNNPENYWVKREVDEQLGTRIMEWRRASAKKHKVVYETFYPNNRSLFRHFPNLLIHRCRRHRRLQLFWWHISSSKVQRYWLYESNDARSYNRRKGRGWFHPIVIKWSSDEAKTVWKGCKVWLNQLPGPTSVNNVFHVDSLGLGHECKQCSPCLSEILYNGLIYDICFKTQNIAQTIIKAWLKSWGCDLHTMNIFWLR